MKRILITSVTLLILFQLPAASFKITGYLPSYRLENADRATGSAVLDLSGFRPDYDSGRINSERNIQYANLTLPDSYSAENIENWYGRNVDEIIYFSIKPGEDGSLDKSSIDSRDLGRLSNIAHLYGTKLTIAVSGTSSQFVTVCSDDSKRERFLTELARFCDKHGFSGIDLDWEFPKNDKQISDFSLLISEADKLFKPKNISLSAAISRAHLLNQQIYDNLQYINLMAYDNPGRHSTFESAVEAVEYMKIRFGVNPDKIRLGIPFYGRIFSGLDPQYWSKTKIYSSIVKDFTIKPDQDEAGGFYFNGIDMVKKKTDYARENGLAGVMVWELGQDTTDGSSLLEAIRGEIK